MRLLTGSRVQPGLTLALAGLAALLALRLALYLPAAATRPSHGFGAVYVLGRLLSQGQDLSQSYDDAWFSTQVARALPGISDVNINPPPLALAALPLALLDYTSARTLWTVLSLLCLGWAVYTILRHLDLDRRAGLVLVAYGLAAQPVWANFQQGQIYLILLALLVLAWQGYRAGQSRRLGVTLGVLAVFKLAGLFLWPLLLVQRRWRALAWGGLTVLTVGLLSLPVVGWEAWRSYPQALLRYNSDPSLAVTAYQTQLGLIWHLFTFDAQWNPTPLAVAPLLATWLPRLSFVPLLGLPLLCAWGPADESARADLLFAALVTANVILSPLSLDYHYPLLLLPTAILMAHTRRSSVWAWFLLGLSMLLIGADLPYRLPPDGSAFPQAWLAYPKLYGAWLVWGLAVWELSRRRARAKWRAGEGPESAYYPAVHYRPGGRGAATRGTG